MYMQVFVLQILNNCCLKKLYDIIPSIMLHDQISGDRVTLSPPKMLLS